LTRVGHQCEYEGLPCISPTRTLSQKCSKPWVCFFGPSCALLINSTIDILLLTWIHMRLFCGLAEACGNYVFGISKCTIKLNCRFLEGSGKGTPKLIGNKSKLLGSMR